MLKTIITDIESVDEAQRAFYKETEGKDGNKLFILQVTGIDDHPDVKALKNAFDTQKATNVDLRTKNEALTTAVARFEGLPEDFTAASYEDLKAKAEKGGKAPDAAEVERTIEERVKKVEAKAAEKQKITEGERDKWKSKFETTAVDTHLTNSLIAAGVKDDVMLKAAKALIRPSLQILEEGDDFSVIARDQYETAVPVASYIKNWADGDEGKRFVDAPVNGGGGGNGDGNNNNKGGKSINRADFDKLDPMERSKKVSEGFAIVD